MDFKPPAKIAIRSDDTEVEFVTMVKKSAKQKEVLFTYRYTKSSEKLGMEVSWTSEYIESQLQNYFEII